MTNEFTNMIIQEHNGGSTAKEIAMRHQLKLATVENILYVEREEQIRYKGSELYERLVRIVDKRHAHIVYNALCRNGIFSADDIRRLPIDLIGCMRGIGSMTKEIVRQLKLELT